MYCGLEKLFDMIDSGNTGLNIKNSVQGDLFDGVASTAIDTIANNSKENREYCAGDSENDCAIIMSLHSHEVFDIALLPKQARCIFELSVNAFDAIIHAWMSELPVLTEIISFGHQILAADSRIIADKAATDRGNPNVCAVQDAASKVWHEIHRMTGLLRFIPNQDEVYIARCEPDHFILPALAAHFNERFGQWSWIIIDEKRRCCLCGKSGAKPVFYGFSNVYGEVFIPPGGKWEELWRHYHKIINNESRNNPGLQKQLMPKRYWKYLSKLHEDTGHLNH